MITPNMLTSLRIVLVPPMIYSYLYIPYYGERIAFFVFAISALTDILDGYMARKYGMITKLGTILDPLADKMMLISVLAIFVLRKKVSYWILVIMTLKELLMVIGGYFLYNNDTVIPANIYGKISTFVFYISGFAIMLGLSFGYTLMNIFVVLNIGTMFIYFYRFASSKV
ncbi:MAG: CDP-alcohol phosphatidyltransferase family protein [Clostridiales bacterium]|nr:CDP-alcohol phosphatidyltransferase family protein [Clostridiales bacterium]